MIQFYADYDQVERNISTIYIFRNILIFYFLFKEYFY
jgi:hypothetical protein